MECHFSVVWCNFRVKDEFNRKILTDTKKNSDLNEKGDISEISAIFRRNCKPWKRLLKTLVSKDRKKCLSVFF